MLDDDLFKVPTAEDRYPREAKRAALTYLQSRRNMAWQLLVAVALVGVSSALPAVPGMIAWGLGVLVLTQFCASVGKMTIARSWMSSLRRLVNYSLIPSGVSTAQYAKSVLADTRAVGKLEAALTTIWSGEGDLELARRVLARGGVPDVSNGDYEREKESPFPAWQRGGIPWQEAPLPDVEHSCTGWTVAILDAGTEKAETMVFCACGGVRYPEDAVDGSWTSRNKRRREESVQR
ncbi:hypothetical protein [Amycolatopsis sp. NPDC004079]|uniref:hypothetical protein n=1 Tax=Amycolatopsis sp. NPDC004079 TaxID=3154549 RepID=UPI0033BB6480